MWFKHYAARSNLGFGAQLSLEGQHELSQLRSLVDISSFSTNQYGVCWRWSNNGIYSARSAYNFLSFDGVDDRRIPHLWRIKIPPRIKIFLWLAAMNKVLTHELLAKRGWHGPSICALCCCDTEGLVHLFFLCPYARSVWSWVLQGDQLILSALLNNSEDLTNRWRKTRMHLRGRALEAFDIILATTCWEIWLERNRRVFDNCLERSEDCGRKTVSTTKLWSMALGGAGSQT